MEFKDQIIIKRWKPILEEYEKTLTKIKPRSFKFVRKTKKTKKTKN